MPVKEKKAAGDITIHATGKVQLSGVNPYGENENGLGSGIYVRSKGTNAGDAGSLSLTASALSITEGAEMSASTSGRGQGGHINLNINGPTSISGNSAHIILEEPKKSQLNFQREFPNYQKNRIAISGIYGNSFSSTNDAENGIGYDALETLSRLIQKDNRFSRVRASLLRNVHEITSSIVIL